MDHAGWRARAAAWVAGAPASLDDCAMLTKTSDVQRGERVGTATSNNAAATHCHSIAKTDGTQIEPLSMDDVREKTFRGLDTASRPLLWRILLGVVDCDQTLKTPTEKRAQYHRWRREFQSYRVDQPAEMEPADGKPTDKTKATKDQAPYLQDAALMREIDKDVSRTRSDLPFFSEGSIQQQWMLRILFVYAKLNPELGYMQGMNEILAPLLFVFGSDSDDAWASEAEPDAFYAFSEIMRSVKLLYNKSPSDPAKTGVDMQMARLAVLLRQHDAILWQHLNSIGLSPDFYSFRWYMTLLAREFSMATTLRIWDALLADSKRFSFLHYVSLALVRSQRAKILTEGFSGALKTLQALVVADIEPALEQAQLMREQDRQKDQRRSSLLQFGSINLTTLGGDRVIT